MESVVHAKVDYLVMGMSAETFWGGTDGAAEFVKFMGELSGGLGVTTGAAVRCYLPSISLRILRANPHLRPVLQ